MLSQNTLAVKPLILHTLINKRRSTRGYNNKQVPLFFIKKIIASGIAAPTGCNNQEIRYIIITNKKTLEILEHFKPISKGCSCFILLFYDKHCENHEIYDRFSQMGLPYIDTGLALMNMSLTAEAYGIQHCICNLSPFHSERIKNSSLIKRVFLKTLQTIGLMHHSKHSFQYFLHTILHVDRRYHIVAGFIIGYSDHIVDIDNMRHGPNPVKRKPIDRNVIKYDLEDDILEFEY